MRWIISYEVRKNRVKNKLGKKKIFYLLGEYCDECNEGFFSVEDMKMNRKAIDNFIKGE
jgi:hypothetical protein